MRPIVGVLAPQIKPVSSCISLHILTDLKQKENTEWGRDRTTILVNNYFFCSLTLECLKVDAGCCNRNAFMIKINCFC